MSRTLHSHSSRSCWASASPGGLAQAGPGRLDCLVVGRLVVRRGFGRGIQRKRNSPLAGGPGAVLFYALLAVLSVATADVRTCAGTSRRGRAGRDCGGQGDLGCRLGRHGCLALIGSGRSPQGVHDLIDGLKAGQPGWLAALDRHAESLVAHQGLTVALVFAALCVVVALSVFLPVRATRAGIVLAVLAAAVIWVVGQNFGLIFVGGATDPNSGPLLILLALAYWPALPPPIVPTEVWTVRLAARCHLRAVLTCPIRPGSPTALPSSWCAVSVYCIGRLALAQHWAGRNHVDVNVSHVLMGAAMVGMLVPRWKVLPDGLWELVFGDHRCCTSSP